MKNTLRILLAGVVSLAAIPPVFGQSNVPGATRSPQNASKPDANRASALSRAIEINIAEVNAGKMAGGKAQNSRVKDFANMMVKDHTDALAKLRALPGSPVTDPKPDVKHQETADRLAKLSGAEFDREYMAAQVSGHQEALTFFEKQSSMGSVTEGSLAKVSKDLLPTVRQHLELAQQIQKDLGAAGRK